MHFFKRLALGAAVAAMSAGGALAANVDGPNLFWKFSTWGNPRAFTVGIEKIAERVKEETGGKWNIQIFYGEQLAKSRENLDGLKNNAFEGAHFCNFYSPDKNPTFMIFTLPFVPMGNWDTRAYVTNTLMQDPIMVADMERWNALPYASTLLPQYEFLGKGKPPKKVEDWSGLRVRAGGGVGQAFELLGATRQTVPASETYTLMERGAVDAVSFPFSYAQAAYRIDELADWFTSNLQPGTSECPIVFNKKAFDALPEQYKELLMSLKDEATNATIEAYKTADAKNLPAFREKMEEIVYSDEELAKFKEKGGTPVHEKWIADNKDKFDSQGLYDRMMALLKEAQDKFEK